MLTLALRFPAGDSRILTGVGSKRDQAIVLSCGKPGIGIYGPYLSLPKGRYAAIVHLADEGPIDGRVLMDVCTEIGTNVITSSSFDLGSLPRDARQLMLEFSLDRAAAHFEVRLHCSERATATVTDVEIQFRQIDAALLDDVLRAISGAADGTIVPQLAARLDRLERLSHGGRATYVGNNRVLTKAVINDTVLGFLVQADDRLIVPHIIVHGDYESTLTSYFATAISAGDHCLDVGANYGYYTCLMAGIAHQGKTIGIEPDAAVFELLRDNICINSYEMLATALHAAVADAPGRLTLHRRVTRSGNTSITRLTEESVRWLGEKAPESFEVDCLSIDDLLLSHFGGRIDVMKVDVEGAEPLVFRGARQAIAANPQVKIVMEWSPGQIQAAGFDLAEFLAALEALRLEAAAVGPTGPVPIAFADLMNAPFHPGILLTVRR